VNALRGLAILIGLGAIAAVTYGTVEATDGIGSNAAPLYIALGALQAAIALSFGVIQSRVVGTLAVLVLLACEMATFIGTADLQLAAIETHAAPIHEAEAKRKAAEDLVARLERDDRVARAEQALATAQADARAKSTAPDCGKGCIATLGKSVDVATAAVGEARQSLYIETRQARAALDKAPVPPQASPLANRLGMEPGTLDLLFVGFRGFAVSAGAAIVLAIGAHGGRSMPTGAPAPVDRSTGNVVALLPKSAGDVDRFLLERVKRGKGSVSWAALYVGYRAWCLTAGSAPVDASAFGAHMDNLRDDLGLKVRTEGQDVLFIGLKLAS
jgi:hypothetical protein